MTDIIVKKSICIAIAAWSLQALPLYAQSLSNSFQAQEAKRLQHQKELQKDQQEREEIRDLRRKIANGTLGDVVNCGGYISAFTDKYVIRTDVDNNFYWEGPGAGHFEKYKKVKGFLHWSSSEYDIKNRVMYSQDSKGKVFSSQCNIIRKETPKSVLDF